MNPSISLIVTVVSLLGCASSHQQSTAEHTLPFRGAVYFLGILTEPVGFSVAVQAFWPRLSSRYATGFRPSTDRVHFRRSDAQLFYHANSGARSGIWELGAPTAEPLCVGGPDHGVGFDDADRIYYVCEHQLMRGTSEILATPIVQLEAVLPSGRTVVAKYDVAAREPHYALLDVDGREVSRFELESLGSPLESFRRLPRSGSTVSGDSAFVLSRPINYMGDPEYIVLRVDDDGTWYVVRRLTTMPAAAGVDSHPHSGIALSDGRVFFVVWEDEPASGGFGRLRHPPTIMAYPPDGAPRTVWRQSAAGPIGGFAGPSQLLQGPAALP